MIIKDFDLKIMDGNFAFQGKINDARNSYQI